MNVITITTTFTTRFTMVLILVCWLNFRKKTIFKKYKIVKMESYTNNQLISPSSLFEIVSKNFFGVNPVNDLKSLIKCD